MAERRLPAPPPSTGSPGLVTLAPGRWCRVHVLDPSTGLHAPDAFNGSGLGNARFSPLLQGAQVVPTLYAARSLEGALMETVLHDVPCPSEGHLHDLARDLASPLHASAIAVTKPLRVVDLTKVGLQRMGLRPSQLFETEADDYPRTRAWAQWLHAAVPRAQGLTWLSARYPQDVAIMLFGDRIRPGIVHTAGEPPRPLQDADVLERLLWLLDRLGCGVAPDR